MRVLTRLVSEVAYLRGALRTLNRVKPVKSTPQITVLDRLETVAQQHRDRIAVLTERDTLTFAQLMARIYRYARRAIPLF